MPGVRLLVLLALCSASAHAEIYKCAGKDGLTVYQNFPCEIISFGASTMRASSAISSASQPSAHARPSSRTQPDGANSKGATAPQAVPRVGMTTRDVRAIWGDPTDARKEEPAEGDIEIWTYADSRSVRFDRKGRVIAIQR